MSDKMYEQMAKRITNPVHGVKKKIFQIEDTLIDSAIMQFKSKYGIEMRLLKPNEIDIFVEWLRPRDPKFKYHISNAYTINESNTRKTPMLKGIFFIKVSEGAWMYIDADSSRPKYNYSKDSHVNEYFSIYIYLFGPKYYRAFKDLSKHFETKNSYTNKIYSIVGVKNDDRTHWNCTASKLAPRTLDTIFIDENQKKRIVSHIDNWARGESMYTDRGLLFKTGILFHGPAGTGKTSMAMAIANYLGCGLITIDPGTFQYMNIPEITESIVADETRYVVLIDEIDAIFKSREDADITEDQIKVTNKLLSFLDSAQSPTGVIFIATTNYPDRLDKSLLRKGRFDLIEELGDISVKEARSMCNSFGLSDDEAEIVFEDLEDFKHSLRVNPATLQDAILTYLKEKNSNIENTSLDIEDPESENTEAGNDRPLAEKDTMSKEDIKEVVQFIAEELAIPVIPRSEIEEIRDNKHENTYEVKSENPDEKNDCNIPTPNEILEDLETVKRQLEEIAETEKLLKEAEITPPFDVEGDKDENS